jgi:uncharacterized lipoprotein YmbA
MIDDVRTRGTLVALAVAAALAACASRTGEHFYTVSAESSAPGPGAAAQRVVVSPIVIPALIDRPQVVVRTGAHEIAVLENHRWGESLSMDLTRALVNDLRQVRPGADIVAAEASQGQGSEQILDVVITELLSGPGASTSLQASWALHDRTRHCVIQESFSTAIPTPAGYGAVPAAYAEAMSRLAEAVAQTIRERRSCAGN